MHLPLQLGQGSCQLRRSAGAQSPLLLGQKCGAPLDTHCSHALNCPIGGGPTRRHNAIRDAVANWLRTLGHHASIEQTIGEWCSPDHGQAVLDVVYYSGVHDRICLDISVIDSVAVAATQGGRSYAAALQRREREKHARYPHRGLVPFAVDMNGRWGMEAENWMRRVLSELPEAERHDARCSLRSAVARGLHSQVAAQVAHATEQE